MDETVVEPKQQGSSRWRLFTFFSIVLAVMLGVLVGVGAFTFGYGKGASYLSNDPQGVQIAT